jgi:hypothetical protein
MWASPHTIPVTRVEYALPRFRRIRVRGDGLQQESVMALTETNLKARIKAKRPTVSGQRKKLRDDRTPRARGGGSGSRSPGARST